MGWNCKIIKYSIYYVFQQLPTIAVIVVIATNYVVKNIITNNLNFDPKQKNFCTLQYNNSIKNPAKLYKTRSFSDNPGKQQQNQMKSDKSNANNGESNNTASAMSPSPVSNKDHMENSSSSSSKGAKDECVNSENCDNLVKNGVEDLGKMWKRTFLAQFIPFHTINQLKNFYGF